MNEVILSTKKLTKTFGEFRALENLSVEIQVGKITGLIGPNGAGKSTLINMLCRFQDPTSGNILIDGTNIKKFSLKDLRESISLVPQKPFLFDVSVEENIAIGKSQYTEHSIEEAAKASNALEFIDELPMKLHERLGEKATRVSGGQLQRSA